MQLRTLALVAGSLTVAAAQVATTPPNPDAEFKPGPPVEQPLPFSHKAHVALGVRCRDCHAIKAPGDFAGLPSVEKCMACHQAIKTESEHIQELADFAAKGLEPPWKRVYQVEEIVYFSHQIHHVEAGVDCAECHGPVAEREVLFQERSVRMYDCMGCHEKYDAPNDCELCHDTH